MGKIIRKILPSSILRRIRLLLQLPTLIAHRGSAYRCPICGYRSKDWAAIGNDAEVNSRYQVVATGRRRAGCYKCHSTDKERLLFLYLQDFFASHSTAGYTILHFAPERGLYGMIAAMPNLSYITADLFPEGYRYFAPSTVKMDITSIPLESNSVDLIICSHVLEHIPNDTQAMGELYRVLKKNGVAILQVPISLSLDTTIEDFSITDAKAREAAFGQADHVRIYGQDYVKRLASVGFCVTPTSIYEGREEKRREEKRREEVGINPLEKIFVATK